MTERLTLKLNPKDGVNYYQWNTSQINMVIKCIRMYFNDDNGLVRVCARVFSYHESLDHFEDFADRCRGLLIAGKIVYNKTSSEGIDNAEYKTEPLLSNPQVWHTFKMEYINDGSLATDTVTLVDCVHKTMNESRMVDKDVDVVTIEAMFLRTVIFTVYETLFPDDCVFECSHPEVVKGLQAQVKAFVLEVKDTLESERQKELEVSKLRKMLRQREAETSENELKAKRPRVYK